MAKLIGVRQVAERLGIGKTRVYELTRKDPDFPPIVKIGKRSLWLEEDVNRYIAAQVKAAKAARPGKGA